jgi:TatD DNase family protein
MIDAHAHLTDPKLSSQLDDVLVRMQEAGVTAALVMGTNLPSSQLAVALARRYPEQLRAAVGVHPHESSSLDAAGLEELRTLARQTGVVAIGEIGLDYHYDFSPREAQREAFRRQLALAAEVGLPIDIHERDAVDDVLAILTEMQGWALGGCWHCCSVAPDVAVEISRALYVGIAGWITFAKGENIREVARAVPLSRILLETDAPYLTPVPFRGKLNEPAKIGITAKALAALKGISLERVEQETVANTLRAFPRWEDAPSKEKR